MLDRVDLGRVHDRLMIGPGHAEIEGRDTGVSGCVTSGYVNTRDKL